VVDLLLADHAAGAGVHVAGASRPELWWSSMRSHATPTTAARWPLVRPRRGAR